MSTTNRDICVESALPVVSSNGLNTNVAVDFSNAPTAAFPAATTIGGSSVVALASITSSATTGAGFAVTGTGIYTGTGLINYTNNVLTTGVLQLLGGNGVTTGTLLSVAHTTSVIADGGSLVRISSTSIDTGGTTNGTLLDLSSTAAVAATLVKVTDTAITTGTVASLSTTTAQTTGHVLVLSSTGTIVTTGDVLSVTANTATTSTGIVRISATGLTSGVAESVTGGGTNMTSSGIVTSISGGANTDGTVLKVASTGSYTGTVGVALVTSAATTGTIGIVSGLNVTSGNVLVLKGTSATLTTGFYLACSDATGNVFTVGSNGHLTSNLGGGTAPVMTTNSTGISATAIVAGSTDVCGSFTTTGTPQSGTVLTCTFHKTYTVAPKFVIVSPLNASAGGVNTMPIIAITATTFTMTWPAAGAYAATPSYAYFVMA